MNDVETLAFKLLAKERDDLKARVLELEARLPHYHNEKQCGVIASRIETAEAALDCVSKNTAILSDALAALTVDRDNWRRSCDEAQQRHDNLYEENAALTKAVASITAVRDVVTKENFALDERVAALMETRDMYKKNASRDAAANVALTKELDRLARENKLLTEITGECCTKTIAGLLEAEKRVDDLTALLAKKDEALVSSHDVMVLVTAAAPGYDWNVDAEGLTLIVGNLYAKIKAALPPDHHLCQPAPEAGKDGAKPHHGVCPDTCCPACSHEPGCGDCDPVMPPAPPDAKEDAA